MNTFPLFFKLTAQKVLIVGGGEVALRKADLLQRAGAHITVVSQNISEPLHALLSAPEHTRLTQDYSADLLAGSRLVIAATDDMPLNQQVYHDAHALGIPVNVVDTPPLCDFIFPAIIDRSPIVVGISSNGQAPVLARLLRARLETLIPQGYGKLAGLAGRFRDEVKANLPTLTRRRQFWEQAFEGRVSQLVFAGKERDAEAQLRADLHAAAQPKDEHAVSTHQGEVYIVGAGPGDPELLTFKALRLMQQADVVFYDALVSPQVLDLCRRDADKIYVGKKRSNHAVAQQDINALLVSHAKKGQRVVRLKGGDPFVFGRGGEEIEQLRAEGVRYEVVPGITAANAAASYAGIPLTHRDHAQSVRYVTGFLKAGEPNQQFESLLNPNETVVFYMGLHALPRLTAGLIEAGRDADTPIAIVSNASMPNQQVLTGTLATIVEQQAEAQLPTPALLIMGDVVALHDTLSWYEAHDDHDASSNWLRGGQAGNAVLSDAHIAHALSMINKD
ncbi:MULTISPECIES: siroheme synthase CysG [unclassified Psychrobacter]|uniref:siroheme synthase CysG n=1 Tax=unclassified Psychrobacter TaxID=196806 RepID=UPI0018F2D4ED|nr:MULTISPECIES: siroheme synthase CysG [unclassified Psychrobacter]